VFIAFQIVEPSQFSYNSAVDANTLLGASVTLDPAWLRRSSTIYCFLSPTKVLKFPPGVAGLLGAGIIPLIPGCAIQTLPSHQLFYHLRVEVLHPVDKKSRAGYVEKYNF